MGRPIPGTQAHQRSDTREFVPTPAETALALELFAQRIPELFPDMTVSQARYYMGRVNVMYTDKTIPYTGAAPKPGNITTGYTWGLLLMIRVDAKRHDIATNSLIHELMHCFLWQWKGNPANDHELDSSGLWSVKTSQWIQSVMDDLKK